MQHRYLVIWSLLFSFPGFAGNACAAEASVKAPHHVVFSVTEEDQHIWNEVFGNFRNIQHEFGPENIRIEMVVYDQAMGMLKDDSLVAEKVSDALADGVKIVACMNSMKAQGLKKDDMLNGIDYVQAGIVELIKLQAAGWAYIRP
jgi:intracellular sulfur oxidation DsrE/DsrF family protein